VFLAAMGNAEALATVAVAGTLIAGTQPGITRTFTFYPPQIFFVCSLTFHLVQFAQSKHLCYTFRK
jgi:hypothetical protein